MTIYIKTTTNRNKVAMNMILRDEFESQSCDNSKLISVKAGFRCHALVAVHLPLVVSIQFQHFYSTILH